MSNAAGRSPRPTRYELVLTRFSSATRATPVPVVLHTAAARVARTAHRAELSALPTDRPECRPRLVVTLFVPKPRQLYLFRGDRCGSRHRTVEDRRHRCRHHTRQRHLSWPSKLAAERAHRGRRQALLSGRRRPTRRGTLEN